MVLLWDNSQTTPVAGAEYKCYGVSAPVQYGVNGLTVTRELSDKVFAACKPARQANTL